MGVLAVVGVIVLALGAYVGAAVLGAFELSPDELEARYRLPDSRFATIGRYRVHFVDQGQGPAVVLIHSPYLSLRAWDSLAPRLAGTHRVVRFDMPGHGLTRSDEERGYSMQDLGAIVTGLMDQLGIARAALVGGSSGATVAFQVAAAHPERVSRLVLISPSGMPRTAATNPNRSRDPALQEWFEHHYRSRAYWHRFMENLFPTGRIPPDPFLDQVHDMNRAKGRTVAYFTNRVNFQTGDPESVLGKVQAPTLILWGLANTTFSPLEADVIEHWLLAAPSTKKKYPGLGLHPQLENPEPVERDIQAFLGGALDGELRRTLRVPEACACGDQPAAQDSR